MRVVIAAASLATALMLGSCAHRFEPDRSARAPVLEGVGSLPTTMAVSTSVPEAQLWFSRGLLQTYAFNDAEAVRDFKAALALDPACAMCAWGVAHALGPNINEVERGDLSEARRYVALAQRHLEGVTPRERALVEALAARYAETQSAAGPAKDAPALGALCSSGGSVARADPLDIVYAARMRAAVEAHPGDPDVTTLYAEAVMIATRGDWWDRASGAPVGEIGLMTERLEAALARAPAHTGLNHFMIHAVDHSRSPQRASAAADRLGGLAPGASHLVHMPSHIYIRTGRYADAVEVNEAALAAQVRQNDALKTQGFDPSVNWNGHNLHFLWYSALMDGRAELALEQARRLADRAAKGKSIYAEYLRGLPLLTLVRLERWDEVLREPPIAGEAGVAEPLRQYARGMALVRTGQPAAAEQAAATLASSVEAKVLAGQTLGDNSAREVLEVLNLRLQAELAAAHGEMAIAQAALQRGIDLESRLEVDPPLLGGGSRLELGGLLLRHQRWADAEGAFRADLVDHPGSGWALRGLEPALARQGKAVAADGVRQELARTWAGADPALRSSVPL
jgi:tetratricopeptide (TPR) repeat protein